MTKHYLFIALFTCCTFSYGQNINQLLSTYKEGRSSEKVRAASELMTYYIAENKDTLEILGDELFQYGIENHYYPAVETGKIILAEYYVETGKTADGIAMAKSLLSAIEERGDYEKLSIVTKLISQGYRFERDAASSLYWAEQAVNYSSKCDDPEVKTYGYLSLAEAYVLNKKTKLAIQNFNLYIEKARPLKLNRGICAAYARLGDVYRVKGNLDKAEYYFNASYKIASKLGRTVSLGHAINNLAIIYFERGDTLKARKYFEHALQLRTKNKDINAICESYYNLGDYQFYIGKTTQAISWYQKSLDYAQNHQLHNQSRDALLVLANAYKKTGNLLKVNESLERCIELDEKIRAEHQRNEQTLKEKQLLMMREEMNAENEGYENEEAFFDIVKPEWIVIAFLTILSLYLAAKIRKTQRN